MWLLIALNAMVLVGLLATVWRLRHVHASLVRERRPPLVREAIQRRVERWRRTQVAPQRTALDEFPSEHDEAALAAFRATPAVRRWPSAPSRAARSLIRDRYRSSS